MDDPTIRRCRGFADAEGFDGMIVVNLYALRATDPRELRKHADPVGPDNDYYLCRVAVEYGPIICAWGANADSERVRHVVAMLRKYGAQLWCLGVTKDGHPRHPLYVRGNTEVIEWVPANIGTGGAA